LKIFNLLGHGPDQQAIKVLENCPDYCEYQRRVFNLMRQTTTNA